jgi:hypothetical protein
MWSVLKPSDEADKQREQTLMDNKKKSAEAKQRAKEEARIAYTDWAQEADDYLQETADWIGDAMNLQFRPSHLHVNANLSLIESCRKTISQIHKWDSKAKKKQHQRRHGWYKGRENYRMQCLDKLKDHEYYTHAIHDCEHDREASERMSREGEFLGRIWKQWNNQAMIDKDLAELKKINTALVSLEWTLKYQLDQM